MGIDSRHALYPCQRLTDGSNNMRRERPKKWPFILAVLLLGVVFVENMSRPSSADASPYHKMLLDYYKSDDAIPRRINEWVNEEDGEISREAISLLKPNVLFQRVYHNERTRQSVSLLLVQCKDARDIYGHYPPICYPNTGKPQVEFINKQGEPTKKVKQLTIDVQGVKIPITRYYFVDQGSQEMVVDNFIIYPPRKVKAEGDDEWKFDQGEYHPNMNEFYELVGDYTRRFYGGSQVQVIYGHSINPEQYNDLFKEIIGGALPFVEAVRSGKKK